MQTQLHTNGSVSSKLNKFEKSREIPMKSMDFDDMLEELGELGKFQLRTYLLICLPVFFGAANSISYVFTAGTPKYRCFVPQCEELNNTTYSTPWLKWAIPEGTQNVLDSKISFCDRFAVNSTAGIWNNSGFCLKNTFTNTIDRTPCTQLVFDSAERTIVNDWDLTCANNQWKLSFVGSSHFAGIIVGTAVFGVLADYYGRQKVFIFSIILMSISGLCQIIANGYITFIVMIFINAIGTAGVYPLAFIIGVELVGKRKREISVIILNYFYAIGEASVALIAWYTQDWTTVQLIVSGPAILFISYYWIIPESVRWLLAHEKKDRAKKIVLEVAKVNRVKLSNSILDGLKENTPLTAKGVKDKEVQSKVVPMIKTTLASRTMIIRFLIIYYTWALNAFVFYGLSINSTSLSGNKYLNFALVCLIEVPAYTIAWVAINKLGRRWSLVASEFLCGLTCTLTTFIPTDATWAIILLFLMGKLGITSSFAITYVHTSEMLPTIIRSGGVGSASTLARLGALLAPFVPLLSVYAAPLPMLLFGCLAMVGALLAIKLPETLGTKLPETIEEAERLPYHVKTNS